MFDLAGQRIVLSDQLLNLLLSSSITHGLLLLATVVANEVFPACSTCQPKAPASQAATLLQRNHVSVILSSQGVEEKTRALQKRP